MRIEDVNTLEPARFVETFGGLYEHSPWVVERASGCGPFADFPHLLAVMTDIVDSASERERLDLLCAHPELAGKAAIDKTLTDASTTEQASAGLDRMTPQEFETFHRLNAAYREKFGFPFIICVRLTDKPGILSAMHSRLENDRDTEFKTALDEVAKIVRIRLEEIIS